MCEVWTATYEDLRLFDFAQLLHKDWLGLLVAYEKTMKNVIQIHALGKQIKQAISKRLT